MIALVAPNLEVGRRELESRRLDHRETVIVTPGNLRTAVGHVFESVVWVDGWNGSCSPERELEVQQMIEAGLAKKAGDYPPNSGHRLVLEVEVPGFYIGDIEAALRAVGVEPTDDAIAEQAEQSMCLAAEEVGMSFVTHQGDEPGVFVQAMVGQIVGIQVKK